MARNSDNTTAATRRHIAHAIKQGYLDFDITLEVDGNGWRSYYPPWEDLGAATWGTTWSEAVNNIDEVLGWKRMAFKPADEVWDDSRRNPGGGN